ncbi:MAG: VTT domain-containing protein [Blastocatellia bacterium]|nr:VTT domain-containing protein [Blastocatellia bacterium]
MSFLQTAKQFLLTLGAPGLAVIAFLDSAGVPMAGGPDALVLFLSWQQPAQVPLIVLAAAIGSALGCLVLYGIGRISGPVALSRFEPRRRAWVTQKMDQHALWAVITAVMAPPPFPMKLIIIAAGVFNMSRGKFFAGVLVGRLIRYGVEGYMGARFGDRAAQVLQTQYPIIFAVLVATVLVVILIRRRRANAELVKRSSLT